MGLFKSLKGEHPDSVGDSSKQHHSGEASSIKCEIDPSHGVSSHDASTPAAFSRRPLSRHIGEPTPTYSSPTGPSPQRNEYAAPPGPPPGRVEYTPPPGPPPGRAEYTPLPGPPPGRAEYSPPLGPPPGRTAYTSPNLVEYAKPIEAPPSHSEVNEDPPPYHDWTVIPDTALLPPPPSLRHETSPANNANPDDADRAHDWCKHNPLVQPHTPTPDQQARVRNGQVGFLKPREYRGDLIMPNKGMWKGSTRPGSNDSCLITSYPLYFACPDSPWRTERKKTIYFEINILSLGSRFSTNESSIALGYCAMPYPTWRLPGWERGSLAVHGDDGRRYVNDTWGGKDFTSAFRVGDTIGLGMSFSVPDMPPNYEALPHVSSKLKIDVFFTRNGMVEGGWDLHEELDAAKDLGVEGLDGQFDLYGAVGTFGDVEYDCLFNRQDWQWLPR